MSYQEKNIKLESIPVEAEVVQVNQILLNSQKEIVLSLMINITNSNS